jgi:hypothetical protein
MEYLSLTITPLLAVSQCHSPKSVYPNHHVVNISNFPGWIGYPTSYHRGRVFSIVIFFQASTGEKEVGYAVTVKVGHARFAEMGDPPRSKGRISTSRRQ